MDAAGEQKPIHSIVLDAGPLILNEPPLSTLRAKSESLFTTASVLSEVKDASARARLESTVIPFLAVRNPARAGVQFVTEFARKSGDLPVLSRTDLEVLALAYELECERNHGDWRLRRTPGQKRVNGRPPCQSAAAQGQEPNADAETSAVPPIASEGGSQGDGGHDARDDTHDNGIALSAPVPRDLPKEAANSVPIDPLGSRSTAETQCLGSVDPVDRIAAATASVHLNGSAVDSPFLPEIAGHDPSPREPENAEFSSGTPAEQEEAPSSAAGPNPEAPSDAESSSSSDGWITPSNIHRRRRPSGGAPSHRPQPTLQVATITADHAVQNVLLLLNLNLLAATPALPPITRLRTTVLRCHACFYVLPPGPRNSCSNGGTGQVGGVDGKPAFCPRCGAARTLTRVTATTDAASGARRLHLKRAMQWNRRGDRFSVPKPAAGSSAGAGKAAAGTAAGGGGRRKGAGGQGGWGQGLVFAEDQKEYVRAVREAQRERRGWERDEGDWGVGEVFAAAGRRGGGGMGGVRVGAGRNVNAKRRR